MSSGHLLYVRQNTLYAVAFDPVGLEVHGEPKPVLPGVASTGSAVGGGIGNGSAQFSVSATGTLAYLPSVTQQDAPSRLALVDRNGRIKYEYRDKKHFRDPRFSPDGKRIAVRIGDGRSERLHVLDPERGTLTNLNFTGNLAALPLWTKDGESLVYASDRGGKGLESYLSRIDGTGETITLTSGGVNGETRAPTSFSPDGTQLLVTSISGAGPDVAVLSMADRKLTPFLSSRAAELFGRFSPDGRWVAYMLQDSPTAMPNVFVRSYPDGGALRQASVEGGGFPIWTKKGAELVYFMIGLGGKNSSVLAVDVTADGKALAFGKPRELFNLPMALPGNAFWYDANSDGSLFAVLLTGSKDQQQAAPVSQTHVTLVFNFFDEIRKATAK